MPANIVSCYQQIGRAGRSIERAYVFLMTGQEDEGILNYFIQTAFPTREETERIVSCVAENEGLSLPALESRLNFRRGRIEKALMFLLNDGFLYKDGPRYYASPRPFVYNEAHYSAITEIRYREMRQMKELTRTAECYPFALADSSQKEG